MINRPDLELAAKEALRFMVLDRTDEELRPYMGEDVPSAGVPFTDDLMRAQWRQDAIEGLQRALSPAQQAAPAGIPAAPAAIEIPAVDGPEPQAPEPEPEPPDEAKDDGAAEDPDGEEEPKRACKDCGETFPLSEFPPEPRAADGKARNCASCKAAGRERSIAATKERHARKRAEKGAGGETPEDAEEPAPPPETEGSEDGRVNGRRTLRELREAQRKEREASFLQEAEGTGAADEAAEVEPVDPEREPTPPMTDEQAGALADELDEETRLAEEDAADDPEISEYGLRRLRADETKSRQEDRLDRRIREFVESELDPASRMTETLNHNRRQAREEERRCENGAECVHYPQIGKPAKLADGNKEGLCFRCSESATDAIGSPGTVRALEGP